MSLKKPISKNLTVEDFSYSINETGEYRDTWRIFRIMAEFVDGYQFLSQFDRAVTILGSARLKEGTKYYQMARDLGGLLAKNKFAVVTGGGPGIMEAGNRGAFEEKGQSIGLNIQLPFEQRINPYVTKATAFYYFFTRKVMLTSPASAFVLFPGGFGTMDEFFEIVDMIDLGMMPKTPVVLVGKEFWRPLIDFLNARPVKDGFIEESVVNKWDVVDSAEEAMELVNKKAIDLNSCRIGSNNFRCEKKLDWKIFRIMAELVEGFEFLTGLVEDVTVLGTKSIKSDSEYYLSAYTLGRRLAEEKYTVVTGGAAGIAEAANKGAIEVGGGSFGVGMEVGGQSRINPYTNKSIVFKFPFTRKVIITAPSKAFIFYPGCFGTMHQLFEVLTLTQTKKMQKIPIILHDKSYWGPLCKVIKDVFVDKFGTINEEDFELCQVVDEPEEMVEIINKARK